MILTVSGEDRAAREPSFQPRDGWTNREVLLGLRGPCCNLYGRHSNLFIHRRLAPFPVSHPQEWAVSTSPSPLPLHHRSRHVLPIYQHISPIPHIKASKKKLTRATTHKTPHTSSTPHSSPPSPPPSPQPSKPSSSHPHSSLTRSSASAFHQKQKMLRQTS